MITVKTIKEAHKMTDEELQKELNMIPGRLEYARNSGGTDMQFIFQGDWSAPKSVKLETGKASK